jgi:hypothetical protein
MSRLTQEERRRVWLAQRQASQQVLSRLAAPTVDAMGPARPDGRLYKALLKTALLVSLLCGGYIATQMLEFHPPASLVEALLPRL